LKVKILLGTAFYIFLTACASLHNIQISEIDLTQGEGKRFEVKKNAMGLNVSEAAGIAGAVSGTKAGRSAAKTVSDVWKAITYGPKTGEVTFTDKYADDVPELVASSCSPNKMTGFVTARETNKYPVISGEIIRVIGYCRK
jgi:hypothetical protein